MVNGFSILEANLLCWKCLKNLTLTQTLPLTLTLFQIRHKYVGNHLNILNMTTMCGERHKYHRNGFTMLKMAYEFAKRLKYVGNDVYIFEMA